MATDPRTWADRVAAWKASGESARAFSRGRGYTSGALYYWQSRLEQRQRPDGILLARVVRAGRPGGGATRPAGSLASSPAPITIEMGSTRVLVGAGFDRPTLEAVIDLLDGRRARASR